MTIVTPAHAWKQMSLGNERFVAGAPAHPHQDVDRRNELIIEQKPMAALFGCSDSRLAAEIIFDKGLGDLFVVRNAGQIISDSVVGSLEYAVGVLGVPLIVVLGHDNCGAVKGAIDMLGPDAVELPPHIANLVARITPAIRRVAGAAGLFAPDGTLDPDSVDALAVGREHLRDTIAELLESSELITAAIAEGNLAIVGANYRLGQGRVLPDVVVGMIE
ncbi:carbonic anhydrase [Alpinimonas psychrophila]|uniref:Carbonic anhydrase n=1 Tax=Alpinimonas psychrophila TaxID=748908 RepID=A0A7W3JRZ0_9MICO|nr:carbonic anhydrase [Alpinimonas psychrophila]MBA8828110.1 carbonic anhydrase [Alpinimonas psychrophila]